MKFFGYKEKSDELLTLSQVSVLATPDKLKELAAFILKCADEMEKDEMWEHEHFNDRNGLKPLAEDMPDFIVCSA